MLLNMIKEAIHLFDVEHLASACDHLTSGHVKPPSQAYDPRGATSRFFTRVALLAVDSPDKRSHIGCMLIHVEIDNPSRCLFRFFLRSFNLLHLSIVELIRRMDMCPTSFENQTEALEDLPDP